MKAHQRQAQTTGKCKYPVTHGIITLTKMGSFVKIDTFHHQLAIRDSKIILQCTHSKKAAKLQNFSKTFLAYIFFCNCPNCHQNQHHRYYSCLMIVELTCSGAVGLYSSGLCLGGGAERRSGVELVNAELVRVELVEAQLVKVGGQQKPSLFQLLQLAQLSQRGSTLIFPEC